MRSFISWISRSNSKVAINLFLVGRLMFAGMMPPLLISCGGGVVELAAIATVIKIIAGTAITILVVQGLSYDVENARLDVERKRLEIEGMKNGQKMRTSYSLTDEQIKTIQEKGNLEIQFKDGTVRRVALNR